MKNQLKRSAYAYERTWFHFIRSPALRKMGRCATLCIFFWLTLATQATSENRIAFVVGTNKYNNLPNHKQLTRSVQDAQDVSNEFRRLGFNEVTVGKDLSRSEFNAKW